MISSDGEPIKGLYAAGELVGGIFWFNYPGGSGLTNGSVFGKIAGCERAGDNPDEAPSPPRASNSSATPTWAAMATACR